MVNYWPSQPTWSPKPTFKEREISSGKIYDLALVKEHLRKNGDFIPGTTKCRTDIVEKFGWDKGQLLPAILDSEDGHYWNSLWCKLTSGYWMPCDSYVLPRYAKRIDQIDQPTVDVYIKFGLSKQTGTCILIVSCHPSGEDDE
ncbi:RING finger protein [Burkholderia cepacia]|uniref:hypothetical protein n=1 Tax=Burkholderia cepacia TaxID=292 RepID=UPI000F5E9A90|nr:hypothetical protein [Burkholderia cepacia]